MITEIVPPFLQPWLHELALEGAVVQRGLPLSLRSIRILRVQLWNRPVSLGEAERSVITTVEGVRCNKQCAQK